MFWVNMMRTFTLPAVISSKNVSTSAIYLPSYASVIFCHFTSLPRFNSALRAAKASRT